MKTYGLIGFPLGHSFSARYFAEKFKREGIDAEYCNFEMQSPDALRHLIEEKNICGLNVTIPHKQAVLPLLDELSPEANEIGAVNVIRIERKNGNIKLVGYNSDVIGFTESIRPLLHPEQRSALVLGTGGASLAIVHGLKQLGITSHYVSRKARSGAFTYDNLTSEIIEEHKIIVNCSPVGMFPHTEEAPAIPYSALGSEHLLYDLVYNPETTRFMLLGEEKGAVVKNGLEMLHLQAEAAWKFWNEP